MAMKRVIPPSASASYTTSALVSPDWGRASAWFSIMIARLACGGKVDLVVPPPHASLAIMVENQADARPQSGLTNADVVYEALAEGGITRFIALYLSGDAPVVGPVRSLRHYFAFMAG